MKNWQHEPIYWAPSPKLGGGWIAHKDSPSPPPAPDYTAAATAQGAANVETAKQQGLINNPNVNTPYGSQQVVWGANGQPTITQTLSPAQQELLNSQNRISNNLAGVAETGLNRVSAGFDKPFNESALNPIQTNVGQNPSYTSRINTPSMETSYDQGGNIRYGNDFNGQVQGQVAPSGQQQTSFANGGPVQTSFNQGGPIQTGNSYTGQVQGNINTSGVQAIPTVDAEARRNAEDLSYRAATSRLDPQWQQRRAMQDTQLRNQGLAAGGEAYDNAQRDLGYQQNDAYLQAQANAVQQGLANQQAQFGMGLAANQAGFGQAQSQGQFTNAAQNQGFSQGLANANLNNTAQGQIYGQNLGAMQANNAAQNQQFGQNQAQANFANTAQQNQFGQNIAAGQFANTAQNQGFTQAEAERQANNAAQAQANAQNQSQAQFANNTAAQQFGMAQQNAALGNQVGQQLFQQGLANANLGNQATQQQIQQQAYLRSLPLNELNALRTGSQVTNPTFQGYNPTQIGQTPVFGAAQSQGQANQNLYNQQAGAANSFNSGLMSLAGTAAGGFFSDRRLKSNIERIGTHPVGIGIYEYDIFGHRTIGVMADELAQVMPDAVHQHGSGYLYVDYGRL